MPILGIFQSFSPILGIFGNPQGKNIYKHLPYDLRQGVKKTINWSISYHKYKVFYKNYYDFPLDNISSILIFNVLEQYNKIDNNNNKNEEENKKVVDGLASAGGRL